MRIIYLSPHLDDALFSCGGIIWDQVSLGKKVEIWTIFNGDPPVGVLSPFASMLHTRWGQNVNPYARRREEDQKACSFMGVSYLHLGFPECIYRKNPDTGEWLIKSDADLFESNEYIEVGLISKIRRKLLSLTKLDDDIIAPLSVGNHLDHKLVRAAASGIQQTRKFYADFPYASNPGIQYRESLANELKPVFFEVSKNGILNWIQAIRLYRSQLDSFWKDDQKLEGSVKSYLASQYGCALWEL
jgi:LmbE family N-acetylglucosaminyl deacetylase